jgi:hypothetical protein
VLLDAPEEAEEAEVLLSDILEDADAAASEPVDTAFEEPTTSLESIDAVSQAASKNVATQIVSRRFIMKVPFQIR